MERKETYDFCKKLMALPYLPPDVIPHLFYRLRESTTTPGLLEVCNYVSTTWISDRALWKPQERSVFNQAIRTNNDVEGWHRRLNHAAGKSNLPFYLLVKLLGEEAQLVKVQLRLLNSDLLRRRQRKGTLKFQRGHFRVWGRLISGELSGRNTLRKIAAMLADFN
jgi:hypothetical protein